MASLTIRNVDDSTKQRLHMRAAEASSGLGLRLRDRFARLAAEEFVAPRRRLPRSTPQWDEPA